MKCGDSKNETDGGRFNPLDWLNYIVIIPWSNEYDVMTIYKKS